MSALSDSTSSHPQQGKDTPDRKEKKNQTAAGNKKQPSGLLVSSCWFALYTLDSIIIMRTIMARSAHDSSFSSRHFHWIVRKVSGGGGSEGGVHEEEDDEVTTNGDEETLLDPAAAPSADDAKKNKKNKKRHSSSAAGAVAAVTKFGSALTAAVSGKKRPSKVTGTLFGHRRGHVRLAFRFDSKPDRAVVLLELAMPTSALVKEMASGLVRIALECERKSSAKAGKLLEEGLWRAYCNGKKCGYAVRRECGPEEWEVLRAVEPVSMGAGVLPAIDGGGGGGDEGEMMYMRAKFERVVGSKDSEAFYMMNPDGNSGPELSIYLLRV